MYIYIYFYLQSSERLYLFRYELYHLNVLSSTRQDIALSVLTFIMVWLETGINFPAVSVNSVLAEAIMKTRQR